MQKISNPIYLSIDVLKLDTLNFSQLLVALNAIPNAQFRAKYKVHKISSKLGHRF
jgi:hypothetical protein